MNIYNVTQKECTSKFDPKADIINSTRKLFCENANSKLGMSMNIKRNNNIKYDDIVDAEDEYHFSKISIKGQV